MNTFGTCHGQNFTHELYLFTSVTHHTPWTLGRNDTVVCRGYSIYQHSLRSRCLARALNPGTEDPTFSGRWGSSLFKSRSCTIAQVGNNFSHNQDGYGNLGQSELTWKCGMSWLPIKPLQKDINKCHRRQEPFCVDCKTYAKLSTFFKYVIKFVGRANPITNFEFAEEYVKNNKQNRYLIFIFLPYPIPNLDHVSHTMFNCVVIAKPFRYLNYEEDYVSTAYLTTYLDFVMATFVAPLTAHWLCGHHKI